jgi:hypothetical protein
MQIFSWSEDQAIVRMVAVEIDGPHIALQDVHIESALLALKSLETIKHAVPEPLMKRLTNAHPTALITPAGVLYRGQDTGKARYLFSPFSLIEIYISC